MPDAAKLPPLWAFRDVSAYGLRWVHRAALHLAPTRLRPVHVTLLFLVTGLLSAKLAAQNRRRAERTAAVLLILKHLLDGLDGALARLQRPSRMGRYLDSVADFMVSAALFGAFARRRGGRGRDWLGGGLGLLAHLLQVSVYNYYYVLYRHRRGGEATSLLDERKARPYPWDPPGLTPLLHRVYLCLYGWQDRLIACLDRVLTTAAIPPLPSRTFMTALSSLGLGAQLAVMATFMALGQTARLPFMFIGPYLAWTALLLGWRRREARCHALIQSG
ncbi:CDP-alcohol phosphatidyltransferase family protein [Rhodothermus bifroesti]|uniref:CDP-alcohol phosphatidyltransferase family protein n=1 Tax=Rhodothermus marinus TaxID=29549 RepID=A0A7V2B0H3_RHOMR|nr:CDP-alcohol phosphatidyltransferase family protein [Rhodothermus bifroesti]GBD01345.1 hypothetical protein HRbin18_01066 [bacterium HR18]